MIKFLRKVDEGHGMRMLVDGVGEGIRVGRRGLSWFVKR